MTQPLIQQADLNATVDNPAFIDILDVVDSRDEIRLCIAPSVFNDEVDNSISAMNALDGITVRNTQDGRPGYVCYRIKVSAGISRANLANTLYNSLAEQFNVHASIVDPRKSRENSIANQIDDIDWNYDEEMRARTASYRSAQFDSGATQKFADH